MPPILESLSTSILTRILNRSAGFKMLIGCLTYKQTFGFQNKNISIQAKNKVHYERTVNYKAQKLCLFFPCYKGKKTVN